VSRPGLHQAALRGLQRDQPADPRDIREHTPIIEPLSLDEAYLDVTENLQGIPLARDVVLRIREKIKAETGLNVSAGISYNKFLAKLASDHHKPNGQYVISPEMGVQVVQRTVRVIPAGHHGAHGDYERNGRWAADRRGGRLIVRERRRDRHCPQRKLRPKIRGTLLADIPAESPGCSATEIEW